MHGLPQLHDHQNSPIPHMPRQRWSVTCSTTSKYWTIYSSFLLSETENRFGAETIPKTFFLRLLDVHDAGHEAGVPEDIFKAIFYSCWQCGRYMTKRVSFNHNEVDSDMDDQGHTFACIYLTACVGSAFHARKTGTPQQVRTLKEFPTLEFVWLAKVLSVM